MNLNTNQRIAVGAGLALLGYLLFGGSIMNFFNSNTVNNEIDAVTEAEKSGFVAHDTVVGGGPLVEPGNTVSVHYVGTLVDGRVFDSSRDREAPFSFTIGRGDVIRGWDEGLIGMREGGKRVLVISPEFGYGADGAGPIPPGATLIFEIELLGVN